MYKMIIVDDEPLIRSGLKQIVEWEVYGIEIIAEAENGTDAYLIIKSQKPDIALIDISMPNMSGLELIELCSHLEYCPKFIILSGYNNFEYVRTAMKYGAVYYLLKPVNRQELIATTEAAVRLLDADNTHKQQFREGLLTLQNDVLIRILTNRIDKPELRDKCRFLDLSFHCSNMRVGMLKPLFPKEERLSKWTDPSAMKLCEKICSVHCPVYTAMDTSDNLILIFKDYTGSLKENDYERILSICAGKLEEHMGFSVITALGEACENMSALHVSYAGCLRTIEHKEIVQNIFQKDSLPQVPATTPVDFDYSTLTQAVEARDNAALQELLHGYFTNILYQNMDNNIESIKYQLIEFIILAMQELQTSLLSNADIHTQKKEAFRIIASSGSVGVLEERLLQFFCTIMEQLNQDAGAAYSPMIQNALTHVRNNYRDCNLSLKTLAGHLDVNAAYLGRQFALETNEYFSDYLNRIRVSKAIHLLKTTSWKTASIATSVGFTNVSYFFTIFKKITGGTPGDFRKSHS